MANITRRDILAGLAAVATPAPALAQLPLTKAGPSLTPVAVEPVTIQEPFNFNLQNVLGARRWQDDLYAGKIALRIRGEGWHWAQLRDDIVSVGVRCWTNQHDGFQTQEQFVAGQGEGLWPDEAIHAGWITVGEPLDEAALALVHRVRFGRVGVVFRDGLMLCDGGNMDFYQWFGRDDSSADLREWEVEGALSRAYAQHSKAIREYDEARERARREEERED